LYWFLNIDARLTIRRRVDDEFVVMQRKPHSPISTVRDRWIHLSRAQ
jgi:hypothetical protein